MRNVVTQNAAYPVKCGARTLLHVESMNRTNEAYRVSCSDLDALREQDLKLPRTNEAPHTRSARDLMQGV